jgi:hypothetical protein
LESKPNAVQNLLVGCVADCTPKYFAQALRLLQSWRWFAGELASADFRVCVVDAVDVNYRKRYEEYGAKVHLVSRFSPWHPPSNKLQFFELAAARNADRVVLLDCDTIVVQDPRRLITGADFVAKIADYPTVTHEIFGSLFAAFGVPLPPRDQRCTIRSEPTIPYFNSGVLSFSRSAMRCLVPEWIRINSSLLGNLELLKECGFYCDQASLGVALAATNTSFEVLGNEMNFPGHIAEPALDSAFADIDPLIIHYHWLVNELGLLEPSRYPRVNRRIEQFNNRLREERRLWLDAAAVDNGNTIDAVSASPNAS